MAQQNCLCTKKMKKCCKILNYKTEKIILNVTIHRSIYKNSIFLYLCKNLNYEKN